MLYTKNQIVKAVVTGIVDYGIFVKLEDNNCGLIHISQIDDKFISNINDYAELNEEIFCEVISQTQNHINLSVKDIDYRNSGKKLRSEKEEFKSLKDNLDRWIEDKLYEIEKD